METMGDLLESVKEFATHKISKEEAQKLFGWTVEDVSVRSSEEDKSLVIVSFDNKMVLFIHYFLNLDPTEDMDNCEFILALKTDLRSRVKYNVYYSGYIHGQGYMRLTLAEVENRMLQRVLEDFYAPALKAIYKPIIEKFRGFYSKDFFGVEVNSNHGEFYYSPVRYRSEFKEAKIWDVISKLHELDATIGKSDIRHALAELDLQMSFLPSVIWSDI